MTTPPPNQDAAYSIDMVSRSPGEVRDSVIRVFDYIRSSTAFVPTDYAEGRCAIRVETQGAETFNVFSIEGVDAMTVDATGMIRAAEFSYLAKPSDYPRLEFIRKTSSVRQVVATLTKTGVMCCYQLREEQIPLSTDQMIFQNGGWIVDDLMASLNLPCVNAGLNSIFSIKNTDFRQTILGGEVTCAYLLDIRFNGRMETRNYYGPNQVQVAGYFIPAPSPPGDEALNQPTNPRNIWRFTISDPEQVFYLNSNQANVQNLAFDYTIRDLRANPGAIIKIEFNAVDGLQLGYQEMSVTLVGYKPAEVFHSGEIAGETWIARESNRFWSAVASSSDGTKLVALVCFGNIYTSTDSGVTWTERATVANWFGVASSSDGTKLLASAQDGQLYTSTDSGVTWTARDSNRGWRGVASSNDGTKLVAVTYIGQIYTSTDSGMTWTARESSRFWLRVASSSDGTKLVATVFSGQIYTSTDSGVTWTARDTNRAWQGVASSSDGTKLVACDYAPGQIYTSTDSGVSWTARESNRLWLSVASSDDGTKLLAGTDSGQLYTSTDSGITWTARGAGRSSTETWYGVASSANGTKLVACAYDEKIYITSPVVCAITGDSASAGPKGLLSQGFEATAAGIFETHRVLDPQLRRVLTPSGKFLTYTH